MDIRLVLLRHGVYKKGSITRFSLLIIFNTVPKGQQRVLDAKCQQRVPMASTNGEYQQRVPMAGDNGGGQQRVGVVCATNGYRYDSVRRDMCRYLDPRDKGENDPQTNNFEVKITHGRQVVLTLEMRAVSYCRAVLRRISIRP